MQILLHVRLPLNVGDVFQPFLQLPVLIFEDRHSLLQDQDLLLRLHLLSARVEKLFVREFECLPNCERDFLRLKMKRECRSLFHRS